MDYIRINKLITKSIYKQIADSIREAIDTGLLSYNDRIPTEKEICQTFSISQTTVKLAYETLINEGKIKRIKGKGTYVTNRLPMRMNLHAFVSFEAMMTNPNSTLQRDVLLVDRSRNNTSAVRALHLDGHAKYYRMVCLYKQHGNPKLLQRIYVPEASFEPLNLDMCENHTIYDFIEQTYQVGIHHLHSTYSAIHASKEDAMLLQLPEDDAIFLVRTKVLDNEETVVAYVCNYYPGAFTELEVSVHAQ